MGKIIEFAGKFEKQIMKPCQYLLFQVTAGAAQTGLSLDQFTIRVRKQNSLNGMMTEIIPSMNLRDLADIATRNEGYYLNDEDHAGGVMVAPVMLHPSKSLFLNNDSFLNVEVEGPAATYAGVMYALDSLDGIEKDFITKYNKYYLLQGQFQNNYSVGDNEDLILPYSSIDEIIFHPINSELGTPTFTAVELAAKSRMTNDVNSVYKDELNVADAQGILRFGTGDLIVLPLDGIRDFEIRRTTAASSVTFFMLNRK